MSAKISLTYAKCCDISPVGQSSNGDSYIKFSVKTNGDNEIYHCTIWEDDEENPRSNFKKWKKILRKGDYYNLDCKVSQKVKNFLDPASNKKIPIPTFNFNVKDLEWIDAIKQSQAKSKLSKQTSANVKGGIA